jgi:hypothetical protein
LLEVIDGFGKNASFALFLGHVEKEAALKLGHHRCWYLEASFHTATQIGENERGYAVL